MNRGFEDARETTDHALAEAVAKQLKPVYCTRCGSHLQIRKLQQNGFDKDTGHPRYDIVLACPQAALYETDVLRGARFTWKNPVDRHTVHEVSKVIELNSDIADTHYKRGAAYDEMVESVKHCPGCGKSRIEGMRFCPQCGQRLTGSDLEEKQRYVNHPIVPFKERNWFERHLNWTMVLAWAGSYLIAFMVWSLAALTGPDTSVDALGSVVAVIGLTVSIGVGQWVLRKKNRSPAWLLICWTWFFLLIDNKSTIGDAYGRTTADYDKLIEFDPHNADAYCERGDFYYEAGEYYKAAIDYGKAIKLDLNDANAYYNRGCAYSEMGEYEKAIADYNKAIELDPNDAYTYYSRGLAYHEKGEVPKAVSDLGKCIGLSTEPELMADAQRALNEMKRFPQKS
jgi:tetratricopeptide (TPR) repeat protein